jgi:dTDP-4-dehydrorhamnose 3,5-epimerase
LNFLETSLKGNYLISPELIQDERGFFARNYCEKEFLNHGLNINWVQVNNSMNVQSETLRGLHFQRSPYEEIKLVRCIKGSVWDVVVDLRQDSSTYGKWFGEKLTDKNRKMMYVPKGFAHGFLSIEPNTEIIYFSSEFYNPDYEDILLWSDPDVAIEWPKKPKILSNKDSLGKLLKNLNKFNLF